MRVPLKKSKAFVFVAFLWIMNALLRIIFGLMSTQGSLLDNPVPLIIEQVIIVMFLVLGIAGFVSSFGLLKRELWGLQGVIVISLLTIAFDIWGITIQFTAALGFIVPALALLFLVPRMFKMGILGKVDGFKDV